MTWFYRFATALSLLTLWAGAGSARADQLWYNGDYDGNSEGIPNGVFQSGQTAYVYDDFIIPAGQTWNITSVYSNNLMNDPTATSSAYVQILSGVVANVGGTSLYMGTDTATQTPTGRTDPIFDTPEYTIAASGLNVTLGPGTYWLTVSPVLLSASDFSYITTTSGANAIGMPPGNDDNSYIDGSYYTSQSYTSFDPASSYLGYSPADFSMGVNGTIVASAIPEPSTLVLSSIAALGFLTYAASRRRRLGEV